MKKLSNLRGQTAALLHGFCRAAVFCKACMKARSAGGRLRAFLHSDGEGQSLVEFAIVLPLMLLVLTFMFSISMAMISYEQLSSAVSQVAHNDLANAQVITGGDPCASIQSDVNSLLPKNFDKTKLIFTVTILNSSGQSVPYGPTTGATSGFTCAGAVGVLNTDQAAGELTTNGTLTVSYPYSWIGVYSQVMSGNLSASQSVLISI